MITHYINLNVRSSNPVDTGISLTQGDYGHVRFVMTVKDGNSDLDGVVSAEITFETPNGCGVNGEVTVENNDYIYVIKGNELQDAGKVYAVLTMTFSDGRVSSCGFIFECRRHPSSNIDAGSYITKIEELIAQATKALNSADGAAALADMAKIAAIAAKNAAELAAANASAVTGVEIATIDKAGLVKPDGSSIEVDIDGTIHSSGGKIATYEKVGLTKPDRDTLGIDEDGVIKVIMTALGLKTKDTNGLLGEANAEVMLQALMDELTNRVVNQILTKSMLINNGLTTESGKYALDAAFGKTLADKDAELASSLAQLNSDFGFKQLWTGSWSSGSITCDISGYSVFKIICSVYPVALIGFTLYSRLIAYGVDNNAGGASRIFCLNIAVSGETLTIDKNTILYCNYNGQNGTVDTMRVTEIYGKR